MISVAGAELIAQVLPVGLLILAVERRAMGPDPFPKSRFMQVLWWLRFAGAGLAAGGAVLAVVLCIVAVNFDRPLDQPTSIGVGLAGAGIAWFCIGPVVSLTMRGIGGTSMEDLKRNSPGD